MTLLIIFLVLFGLVHLIPAVPSVKAAFSTRLGRAYGPLYGIASTVLLVACIWAFRTADRVELYDVPAWGRHANFGLTFLGFLCIGIFLFRGSWRNTLRYPMAIGVVLWAAGHLMANGDSGTTVFFIAFAFFAVLHAVLKAASGPFVPTEERGGHNLLSLFAGLALYGLMTQLHAAVTGMPLITLH